MEQSTEAQYARKKRLRLTRRWISRIGLSILAVAVVVAIVVATLPKPVFVETATVRRADLVVSIDEDGRTRIKDQYVLSAPLAGNLARIELEAGDQVKTDMTVAHLLPSPAPLLDPRSYSQARSQIAAASAALKQAEAGRSRAEAAAEFAESELTRQQKLVASGSISQQDLEQMQLQLRTRSEELASSTFGVRVARYQAEIARAALGRLNRANQTDDQLILKSPVDGVVLEVLRESEGVVQAGTPLLAIGNPAALEIVVDVLTADAVRIAKGASATITRWGGKQKLQAHVRRVEPKAFSRMSSLGVEEQRVNVLLDLDSPRHLWKDLGDGYRVEASIVVWQAKDVLQVPVSAVFNHNGKWAVFVDDDGLARRQYTKIGERNGFVAQVLAGLRHGQRVVIHPGERVSDGIRIRAR